MGKSNSKGWVKIERDIIDHWVFQDAEYFRAWMLILLMANHEEHTILIDKVPTKIPPGAFHSSLAILAQRLGWTKNRILRYTKMLEMDAMLRTKRTAHGTTFFVINWPKYQGGRTTNGASDRTADATSLGTSGDTQTRKNKNDKEWEETRVRARGGNRYKTQDEKMAATRALVERLDREEKEREQKRDA